MAEATAPTKSDRLKIMDLAPFTVEFGCVYNSTFYLTSLRRKVRGEWKVSNFFNRPEGGRELGPITMQMPDIPGMYMDVIFAEHKVRIYDPLKDKPEILDKINTLVKRSPGLNPGRPYKAVDEDVVTRNPDQMQTLIRELRHLHDTERCRLIRGKIPTEAEMAKVEGRLLYDPGSNNPHKPKYTEDAVDWFKEMHRFR